MKAGSSYAGLLVFSFVRVIKEKRIRYGIWSALSPTYGIVHENCLGKETALECLGTEIHKASSEQVLNL